MAIFGAGVSGLTVAHELSERGFEVDVYEPDVGVGGMARTQYSLPPHSPCAAPGPCSCCCCNGSCGPMRPMEETVSPARTPKHRIAFSEDGELIASGSIGVSLYRVDTGMRVETFGHREEITAIAIASPKRGGVYRDPRVITANQQGFVEVWDPSIPGLVDCLESDGPGPVLALEASYNEAAHLEIVGSRENEFFAHTLAQVHEDLEYTQDLQPEPTFPVTAVWLGEGCCVQVAFGGEEGRLEVVVRGCDGVERLCWRGACLDTIEAVRVSRCGCYALLLDNRGRLQSLRIDKDRIEALTEPFKPEGHLVDIGISNCGGFALLAFREEGGTVLAWRELGDLRRDVQRAGVPEERALLAFSMSPGGRTILSGHDGGELVLWSVYERGVLWRRRLHEGAGRVLWVSLSDDGRFAASAVWLHGDVELSLWDAVSGERLGLLEEALVGLLGPFDLSGLKRIALIRHEGRRALMLSAPESGSGRLRIVRLDLDMHNRKTFLNRVAGEADPCPPCPVKKDPCEEIGAEVILAGDQSVLSGRADGKLTAPGYDPVEVRPRGITSLAVMRSPLSVPESLVYFAAVGFEDGVLAFGRVTLMTVNVGAGVIKKVLFKSISERMVHDGAITSLLIQRDLGAPTRALSGGLDRRIKVWVPDFVDPDPFIRWQDFKCERTLLGHEGPIMDLIERPGDTSTIAAASRDPLNRDNTVILWDLNNGQEIQRYGDHPWRSLPGEHGFRFFPAFYRHLFDTMARTRLREDKRLRVSDNLVATTNQGIALEDGLLSHEFTRKRQPSVEAVLRTVHRAMSGLGYTMADILRFQVKTLKYLTSCAKRRRTYQDISWWEFMEGERFSPKTQHALNVVPRVLVAMDAKRGDALTQGNIMIQLLMDQQAEGEHTDRVLNGPSTEAWLSHWQDDLEDQGVRFHFGKALERLFLTPDRCEISSASVRRVVPRGACCLEPPLEEFVHADFYVMAVPMRVAQCVVKELRRRTPGLKLRGDLKKLARYNIAHSEAWMSGVQYYLADDVSIVHGGHVYYPDSAWGLSLVSQAQFWDRDVLRTYGVGGIISVVVGDWHKPVPPNPAAPATSWWDKSEVPGRRAVECSSEEIAREVWRQINMSSNGLDLVKRRTVRGRTELPEPLFYHMDDNLDFSGPQVKNSSRYLIAPVGEWDKRPGRIDDRAGYKLQLGNLTMAGNFMKTHTRLTTMESANESGRHAANGIMASERACFRGERAAISPMDRWEPLDARSATSLDEILFDNGLPHMLDILDAMDQAERQVAISPDRTLGEFLRQGGVPEPLRALLAPYAPALDAFYAKATALDRGETPFITESDDRDTISGLVSFMSRWIPME